MPRIQIPDPPYRPCKILTANGNQTWTCNVHNVAGEEADPAAALAAIVQHITEATFHSVAYALMLDLHETVTECKDD